MFLGTDGMFLGTDGMFLGTEEMFLGTDAIILGTKTKFCGTDAIFLGTDAIILGKNATIPRKFAYFTSPPTSQKPAFKRKNPTKPSIHRPFSLVCRFPESCSMSKSFRGASLGTFLSALVRWSREFRRNFSFLPIDFLSV